jgi:hypothetical protein
MQITLRQIRNGNLLANKHVVTPPAQTGGLNTANIGQLVQSLSFDTLNEPTPGGTGYINLVGGDRLRWDGEVFALYDGDDAQIEVFYNGSSPAGSRWKMGNYAFAGDREIAGINIADPEEGIWHLAVYQSQPPQTMRDVSDIDNDLSQHAANEGNPHNTTAHQAGTYTSDEIDEMNNALVNQVYERAYWWGRRYSATAWPLPADGETWATGTRNAFDFQANTPWRWNGADWEENAPIALKNGIVVGITQEFLDITEAGLPGLARYSETKSGWDFYPNKYEYDQLMKVITMPGVIDYGFIKSEAALAQWRRMPADGRTIPVADRRAERLLQYCLIPHSAAVANQAIKGMYLTNDYYPDHASWLAADKLRPTPAESGAYLVIPDMCGVFPRGAGVHGGDKAANGTPYDGKNAGSFGADAIRKLEGTIIAGHIDANVYPTWFDSASGVFRVLGSNGIGLYSSSGNGNISNVIYAIKLETPDSDETVPTRISLDVYMIY